MTHDYDPAQQTHIARSHSDSHSMLPATEGASAVSWGAIFAGALAAAALSLLLITLGTGLGLSAVSPWENRGVSAETLGLATIAWLLFTQIAASGMGGYLAGRLRTKWVDTHVDEVYFRDTAHGFLAWSVAAIVSIILLTSTLGSLASGGSQAAGAMAGGAAAASVTGVMSATKDNSTLSGKSMGYFVDALFRRTSSQLGNMPSAKPMPEDNAPVKMGEVTGIFANALSNGSLSPEDQTYIAQLISQKTGISQAEAVQRVQNGFAKAQAKIQDIKTTAQKAADTARKTTSHIALWTFIAWLIGAFIASLSATFGGRQRDL